MFEQTVRHDSPIDILLVGYERQENLGLRSIVAYLESHGRRAILAPFYPGDDASVLSAVQRYKPLMVGFSLIFQFSLEEFGGLMRYLRAADVQAHFTAGGHFPSLRPHETLELIPELDSIVRFEGEITLFELLQHLDEPGQWKEIAGLSFKNGTTITSTALRPLIADLDTLPVLFRDESREMSRGVKTAAILASRGCLFDCSFCSIRQFYGASRGALRRVRSPRAVANEMLDLYNINNIQFFSFQDDDFAARSPSQRQWLTEFLGDLRKNGLARTIAWKVSCRVDDLEPEFLTMMLDHGLLAVYLGVESGNDSGLQTLNKRVGVAQNLAAIHLLKRYNVAMSMGFMLFDPSSTIDSVRSNISFLKTVGSDGYFPINFCKMLPYAGTPIEQRLREEKRLVGTLTRPEYGFEDARLDWYEFFVQRAFFRRNFSPDGIVAVLQQMEFDWRLTARFAPSATTQSFGDALRRIIRTTNRLALTTLEAILDYVVSVDVETILSDEDRLVALFEQEWRGEMLAEVELQKLRVAENLSER